MGTVGAAKARVGKVVVFATKTFARAARRAVPGRGDLWGGEEVSSDTNGPGDRWCLANGRASWPGAACKASAEVGVRSALRDLTRRGCLGAAPEGRVASSATRPRREHRSEAGAKRKPHQRGPLSGTARRAALNHQRGQPDTSSRH